MHLFDGNRSKEISHTPNSWQRFEVWRTLLETAIRTPSPHNVQPWRIRLISEQDAELLIDGRRTLPEEDTTGSFILSAMGMFVEAIALLAPPRGFSLEYELGHAAEWYAKTIINGRKTDLLPFARLHLAPCSPRETLYPESLFCKRRTSRICLLPTPIGDTAIASLTTLASQWGQRYEQITDAAQIENILAQNSNALFEDLNTPAYHDEIVSWFRFTDRAAKRHRDGLDWRCMNTSRTAFWLVARIPKILVFPFTRSLLRRQYRRQLGPVPTIGILAGDFFRASSAFETGRFLIRFWLETARLGLFIHPYGNLVTNPSAANWLVETTNIKDIWLIFKIGHSEEPPMSYRRSLADVMVA
jgi:nitroreductase